MTDTSDSNDNGKRDDLNAAEKNSKSDDSTKSDGKKQLNVRISTELHNKLDNIPESKAVIVTKALEKYLDEDDGDVVSQEYVTALLKQLDIKDAQIAALNHQLQTKDDQILERDNTTKMHIAQVQTLINQVEKKTLELEDAKKKKWYQFW
ncbi:hypothetical protein LJC08_02315 [Methanimicrococcus sp. OttesenSCG-928-J09]|nr:hypothetical protein [Methanimicrococcus sp. OttesenSCG-928-J09]